jgi:hypothetical protein
MRNSGEIVEAAEKLVMDLDKAGCAAVVVFGIPGIRSMKYATNLARFGQPGLDEFAAQIRRLQDKVQRRIDG